jgi:hypothetical protein
MSDSLLFGAKVGPVSGWCHATVVHCIARVSEICTVSSARRSEDGDTFSR